MGDRVPHVSEAAGYTAGAPAASETCGACREVSTEPNDLVRFGTLDMGDGRRFRVCGDCIQVIWHLRAPGAADLAEVAP